MMRRHSSIDDMSILLYTYRQRTYLRFPSIRSMNWSTVQSSRKSTCQRHLPVDGWAEQLLDSHRRSGASAELILYSCSSWRTSLSLMLSSAHVDEIETGPELFFLK